MVCQQTLRYLKQRNILCVNLPVAYSSPSQELLLSLVGCVGLPALHTRQQQLPLPPLLSHLALPASCQSLQRVIPYMPMTDTL